ncbi:LysE family transporter [Rhizobium beringeri]
MDTALWTMFCIMFFTTLAVPGPNVAFSVAQSLHYGSRKASAAAIGFALGTGLHAVIVLSGVGLLAQKYEIILHIIKWGGITLILYQALKAFSVKPTELVTKRVTAATTKELILGAIAVSCTESQGYYCQSADLSGICEPQTALSPASDPARHHRHDNLAACVWELYSDRRSGKATLRQSGCYQSNCRGGLRLRRHRPSHFHLIAKPFSKGDRGVPNFNDDLTFDYVIVGGGSVGAVIARRLADAGIGTIALIEAGPLDEGVPCLMDVSRLSEQPTSLDWGFLASTTDAKPARLNYSRAKVLGGCGTHNDCAWLIPPESDFAEWERLGAKGWGPQEISFPYQSSTLPGRSRNPARY